MCKKGIQELKKKKKVQNRTSISIIAENEKYEIIENSTMTFIESRLKDEKLNHALFMKKCQYLGNFYEENIMSMIGTKLTSKDTIEEYKDNIF